MSLSSVQNLVASAIDAEAQGKLKDADRLLTKALAKSPRDSSIRNFLAIVQIKRGQLRDALKTLLPAAAAAPRDAMTRINLGGVLCQLNRHEQAVEHLRAVTDLTPDSYEAFNNLGQALRFLKRWPEACAAFRRALVLSPGNPRVVANYRATIEPMLAECQADQRHADTLAIMAEAMAVIPDWTELRHSRSTLLLSLGRLAEGWGDYIQNYPDLVRLPLPEWDGETEVEGSLLVRSEQGIGEQIMFTSVIPDLQRRCRHLVVEADHRLLPLLSAAYPGVTFAGWRDPPDTRLFRGDIVAQTQMSRSFGTFRPDVQAIAAQPCRLSVDPAQTEAMRNRLAVGGKPLVGFSWASPRSPIGDRKTIPLPHWSGLFDLPAHFLPLQYDDDVPADAPAAIPTKSRLDPVNDLVGLAAAISACDLVVTISNFIAHLAGSLGVPTLILLGHEPLWHWFRDTERCPWYPSATIMRRLPSEQDWSPLMARVGERVGAAIG